MEKRPLVVLLGNSLLMDGVAVSLNDRQTLGMVRMDRDSGDIRERLKWLDPDLIVFELDDPNGPSIISLLKDCPDTLLIGLDLDCSRAIVLNSRQHLTQSMNELQHIVQSAVDRKALASDRDAGVGKNNVV
ncbi:MAG: hypothetical protein JSW55_11470 [Chloroflexota bacterium]|nr:MAG: hypothetical protein JSW55_11470 [Chloroflexota bacterium]